MVDVDLLLFLPFFFFFDFDFAAASVFDVVAAAVCLLLVDVFCAKTAPPPSNRAASESDAMSFFTKFLLIYSDEIIRSNI